MRYFVFILLTLCFIFNGRSGSAQTVNLLDPSFAPTGFQFNEFACQKFSSKTSKFFPVSSAPSNVVTADFNNDSYPELAVFSTYSGRVRVYLNDRAGGFNQSLDDFKQNRLKNGECY